MMYFSHTGRMRDRHLKQYVILPQLRASSLETSYIINILNSVLLYDNDMTAN